MESRLTILYKNAQEMPDVISFEEATALVLRPLPKTHFHLHKGIYYLLICLVGLFGLFYFLNTSTTQLTKEQIKNEQKPKSESIPQLYYKENKIRHSVRNHQIIKRDFIKRPLINEEPIPNFDNQTKFEFKMDSPSNFLLSFKQLESFGIYTNGHKLKYENFCDTSFTQELRDKILQSNRTDTFPFFYCGIDLIETGGGRTFIGRKGSEDLVKKSTFFYPAYIQLADEKITDVPPQTMLLNWNNVPESKGYDYVMETKHLLIPIEVYLEGISKKNKKNVNLVFWFKPEQAFLDSLPSNFAAPFRRNAEKNLQDFNNIQMRYLTWHEKKINVLGLDSSRIAYFKSKFIYPSKKQLKKIGFSGLLKTNYSNRFKVDDKIAQLDLTIMESYTSTGSYLVESIRKGDRPYYPVACSKENLENFEYYYISTEKIDNTLLAKNREIRFLETIDELIPVVIKTWKGTRLVMWFTPHPDLKNILRID